jgi:predicted dehydrogenase
MCFTDSKDLLALGKIADVAIISTMDRFHLEPTMAAISLHYDILLEKPVAPTPEECEKIAQYAEKNGVKIVVCHVLRYTPFFITVKQLINDGVLGDIISINHEECVGHVHQSHSFVRGNWGNSQRSSNMLLQKSCHDMDILQWLLDKKCKRVHSFGSLTHFNAQHAPEGAPERCIDGCPHADSCPYNAVKLYLDDKKNAWFRTSCTKHFEPTDADVEHALRTTNYGRCVYKCDNDVVDHQVVNMEFEGGVTCSFTMCAFTEGGRHIRIMGTKGELSATMGQPTVRIFDFEKRRAEDVSVSDQVMDDTIVGGHGGGDQGIIACFYDLLCGREEDSSLADISVSVSNHMIAFAAEQSRLSGCVVDVEEYERAYREQVTKA